MSYECCNLLSQSHGIEDELLPFQFCEFQGDTANVGIVDSSTSGVGGSYGAGR